MSLTASSLRLAFFDYLFEDRQGFLCIAHRPGQSNEDFDQKFFSWPDQREGMGAHIEKIMAGNDVWFGVNLFRRPERNRDYAVPTNLVWADLDYCDPADVVPPPQCRIMSSPKRFQALWRLDKQIDPVDAQTLAKRIAYAYADRGADKGGWDISQLLRVPFTHNYKYDDGATQVPEVQLISSFEARLPVDIFDDVTTPVPEELAENKLPVPELDKLPDVSIILYKYQNELRNTPFNDLYLDEPQSDWSAIMWRLINILLEAGMTNEEAFTVTLEAKCNKYERDSRPVTYLWREVLKAEFKQNQINLLIGASKPLQIPRLFEGHAPDSFVKSYKAWAEDATDAVHTFHELAATILLSCLSASGLYLQTSFGKVVPNLWGLVLGESTFSRKTTAMKMAMEFVGEIDREIIVATEGSVEGVLTALANRPSQVSVFYKDEVSGFFDSINRKDYLAGMIETLTQLYDVPEFFTRRLRKETITITNPVFIFFGGGIRERVYETLSEEHILSGFMPRFLIVGGDADIEKLRPTGPMLPQNAAARAMIKEQLLNLHDAYSKTRTVEIAEANTTLEVPTQTEAFLTDDAWKYFQHIEKLLTTEAAKSPISMVAQPTFGRLAWSCVKMGMLFAAVRQHPEDGKITVEEHDLMTAAYYIEQWGPHTIDLIQSVGKSANQRLTSRILDFVRRRPGCTRSDVSRNYHLEKRELDLILDTLLDRGQIRVQKLGRGYAIHPL